VKSRYYVNHAVAKLRKGPVAVILDCGFTKADAVRTFIVLIVSIATVTATFGADDRALEVNQLFAMFDKPGSPGCSVGIIRDGDFVYKRSFGYASLELGVPLTPASVFYMGSVSKQFTAASIVLAAEQDRLSLDDDVRKYLPELPDYGDRISPRQPRFSSSSRARKALTTFPVPSGSTATPITSCWAKSFGAPLGNLSHTSLPKTSFSRSG
jgi:hypothetical protein